MSRARSISLATGGAFDVSVQPLWKLYARHFATPTADPKGPAPQLVERARALVDQGELAIGRRHLGLGREGAAVTLNGIAQGYITDRVIALLRRRGIARVFVDLGESRVLGVRPDGRPWQVGLVDPTRPDRLARTLPLVDRALATSGGYGTRFDASGRHHNLFDPATGRSANHYLGVSILAPDATTADALSTGLYALPLDKALACVDSFPDVAAHFTLPDGKVVARRLT